MVPDRIRLSWTYLILQPPNVPLIALCEYKTIVRYTLHPFLVDPSSDVDLHFTVKLARAAPAKKGISTAVLIFVVLRCIDFAIDWHVLSESTMYEMRQLLLSAISLLVFTRIDSATATLYQCGLPAQFSVGTAKQDKATFLQSHITVNVPDHGYSIFTYPGSNTIAFGAASVIVEFRGHVTYDTPGFSNAPAQPIYQTFEDRISGVAQRVQVNLTDSSISDCHLYLMSTGMDRLVVSSNIANEIIRRAELCLQTAVCEKIGKMNSVYRPAPVNQGGVAQLPGLSGTMIYRGALFGPLPFQNAINMLMNSGLQQLIAGIRTTGQTKIKVPKISKDFKTTGILWNTKGHLDATNGTFSGLTTMVRKSEPAIIHEGGKFVVSCKFAINSPKLKYDYKLKHGTKRAGGKLTATATSVTIEAKFAVDYATMPCTTTLQLVKVTDFGKVNRTFTTIGALKSVVTNLTVFDKKVKSDIERAIEQRLRNFVETPNYGLGSFNCELFRP